MGWVYSLVVEHLYSICKALSVNPAQEQKPTLNTIHQWRYFLNEKPVKLQMLEAQSPT